MKKFLVFLFCVFLWKIAFCQVVHDSILVLDSQKNKNQKVLNKDIENVVSSSGNALEDLIKLLPGVSSVNNMSSSYNVRGGSFDENLLYINGIEISRVFHINSSEQEGLSMINPMMVEKINFSTGGFGVEYGDKMSSVLDIKYRKPDSLKIQTQLSFLGANFAIENKFNKFSFISSLRYRQNSYLLKSLNKKGEYNPNFLDNENYLIFRINSNLSIELLSILQANQFDFQPQNSTTSFGTMTNALMMTMYFDGMEKNRYFSNLNSISLKYFNHKDFSAKVILYSNFNKQNDNYDILSQYYLTNIEDFYGKKHSDSTNIIGIGEEFSRARNQLVDRAFALKFDANYCPKKFPMLFGFEVKNHYTFCLENQYQIMDSSGYFVDISSSFDDRTIDTWDFSIYYNKEFGFDFGKNQCRIDVGIRDNYSSFYKENIFSPRVNFWIFAPKKISYRLAIGKYSQQLSLENYYNQNFYQNSYHYVFGLSKDFRMMGRNFKFFGEIYLKQYDKIVPYTLDNVKIIYQKDQVAKAYNYGADFKLYGQFVKGYDSWISISLLKSMQDILGDDRGYFFSPNDRRMSFSLFFRDYFPGFDFLDMNLMLMYSTRQIFYKNKLEFRGDDYLRCDIGFLASPFFRKNKNFRLGIEIFNLFDVKNTVSYTWVKTVKSLNDNDLGGFVEYAVPNYLSSRRLNLKISYNF